MADIVEEVAMVKGQGRSTEPKHVNLFNTSLDQRTPSRIPEERVAKH